MLVGCLVACLEWVQKMQPMLYRSSLEELAFIQIVLQAFAALCTYITIDMLVHSVATGNMF